MQTAHSPPSPGLHPAKRPRQESPDKEQAAAHGLRANAGPSPTSESGGHGKVGQSSNFRNVSACNRCRLRKNRCDQRLPRCASCEKANVVCIGYDPITKKEIPRSYVYYLEVRVAQLEALLESNHVAFPPAENLEHCSRTSKETGASRPSTAAGRTTLLDTGEGSAVPNLKAQNSGGESGSQRRLSARSGALAPYGGSSAGYGSLSGSSNISFARVVFAAVQSSVSDQRSSSERTGIRPYKPIAGNGSVSAGTSMRDSFFGLHTKPTIRPATFPGRELGHKLVTLYFEHANPQIPVLHRVDFMHMFEQAYAETGRVRGRKELYMLNMVFAIGGGIFMTDSAKSEAPPPVEDAKLRQCQPEEYHASAIVHLEACLSNSGGGLEELQAVLLLANFALLRPVPPGLWYIVGVAVRLAVDLGLHYEDGKDAEAAVGETDDRLSEKETRERGRRQYIRDQRRRLWWCTYSLDRLVSVCVGRPFGISDQVITTEFPSLREDRHITAAGFVPPSSDVEMPTYKLVAHHYFRLRLLQSEILQVLQYQATQNTRALFQPHRNPHMHTDLPSPFLSKFDSFRSWRMDIDLRLQDWKEESPTRLETGVDFSTDFLDLNFWQAVIMLYRQSLSVPAMFEGEYHTSKEVESPTTRYQAELRSEDEDRVYLKVAEAGQKILRLYRSLHLVGQVNYTYLATHHLFMAGISYLYAIWHSPVVRSKLTMDDFDFTILAGTSVFTALIEKCPPAEACRDAFDRTARATIRMANSKGGFGQPLTSQRRPSHAKGHLPGADWKHRAATQQPPPPRSPLDQRLPAAAPGQFDLPDAYPAPGGAAQAPPRYPPPAVKTEPDGFPTMLPTTGGAASPLSAPPTSLQSSPAYAPGFGSPGGLTFADLQGMDFLLSLGGGGGEGGGGAGGADLAGGGGGGGGGLDGGGAQMDLGFGLGWEGLHHDFSDGQQVDLFDGFFFGGQQGGGAGG